MIPVATRIEKSKNEDRTLITKPVSFPTRYIWTSGSDLFNSYEKQLTSGSRSETEVEKLTVQ